MKGPYERLKYDFRRVWECPVCHHRDRTDGSTTACLCRCQKKLAPAAAIWMRLVDEGPRRTDVGAAAALPASAEIDLPLDDPPSPSDASPSDASPSDAP